MTKSRKAKTKNKGGRPKKSVKQRVESINFDFKKIKQIAECGMFDVEFTKLLGISNSTLNRWKKEDEEFLGYLKGGKKLPNVKAVASLFKRVTGYQYQEVTREYIGGKMMVTKVVTKEMPPDVGAIAFFLKNRESEEWKERIANTTELPNEEIEALRKLAQKVMAENV